MAKILTGKVVSTKMQKTVVVEVERVYRHALYKKIIRQHKRYKARLMPNIEVKDEDMVKIKETRPLSKEVRFLVIEKL